LSHFLELSSLDPLLLNKKYTRERQGGGVIINISSVAAIRYTSIPYITYYANKAGILGLTQGIALQYAAKNIRANCILPGLMDTLLIREPLKDFYAAGGCREND